jgi:D-sedoheptulose 7-phosphate isomerase
MFNTQQYITDYVRVLRRIDGASVERMAEIVVGAWSAGRTVFICGNGGSAASASHLATDLTKLTAFGQGPRLRAMALNESGSSISAIANDIAYEQVFAEQLRAFCQYHDVVIGLSTSGSSPNVLRAIEYANSVGAFTIGMTGRNGTKLQNLAFHTLMFDSTSVQHLEDATMAAGHMLCLRVKEAIQLLQLQGARRAMVSASLDSPAVVEPTLPMVASL